ncbi:MAG: membrane protein insertion efficiency factor YidD [Alphaproteobacteria bacterium]|nr:membrane protein insertion efficiency factor YidD [Alphaproteobacteria bacterium]NCQ88406.1 membrane protein insertion efficiency factor YidD [Alphaproteobacteria bacterium]NCT05948.1 membrane protein insertion efficiency factor YidD [Alphaproteobacteria bacterium]
MKIILKTLVKGYCWLISPMMGQSCRFYPTCSAYALEAIERHGSIKGLYLTVKRLMKCHPYHKGDHIDPVPELKKPKD